jgi:hypothetical protein
VIDAIGAGFVAGYRPGLSADTARLLGQWVIRPVVSLLTLPGAGEDEERANWAWGHAERRRSGDG